MLAANSWLNSHPFQDTRTCPFSQNPNTVLPSHSECNILQHNEHSNEILSSSKRNDCKEYKQRTLESSPLYHSTLTKITAAADGAYPHTCSFPALGTKDMKWQRSYMMTRHLHVNDGICSVAITWQQDEITMEVACIQTRDREAIPISCNTHIHIHRSKHTGDNAQFWNYLMILCEL